MREMEGRDVLNKRISVPKQWDGLRSRGVIGAHGWQEVEPAAGQEEQPQVPQDPKVLYQARGHTP
eukprot:3922733-Lingulodinium_polyedra.AAC.1